MHSTKKITLDGIEMDEDFSKVFDACLDLISVCSGQFKQGTSENELLRGISRAVRNYRVKKLEEIKNRLDNRA